MRLTRDSLIVLGIVAAITVTYVVVVYRRQSSTLEAVGGEAEYSRRVTSSASTDRFGRNGVRNLRAALS